jgi:plasmid replication initiation protein
MSKHLSPDRHPQQDFFVADILDCMPKDDRASMEHPIFALKAGDKKPRRYERNGNTLNVFPGYHGLATIHDKDIWIYCISQMVEAMNRGCDDITRTVRFTAYDFLVTTNRPTSGVGYQRFTEALRRLKGTTLETNIKTNGIKEHRGFGLIEEWLVIERESVDEGGNEENGRMIAVEVTLPDWLFRAIENNEVLTLSREYFRLRKPLDRRVYELARKHCGSQPSWKVNLDTLHEKSGSTASLREFRRAIRSLAKENPLPTYRIMLDEELDQVLFYHRGPKGHQKQIKDIIGGVLSERV